MSAAIDSSLPSEVRAQLLDEIRNYLPAFLRKDASEQHDPVGDVKELLNLEDGDLKRVLAVHGCLDESVLAFGSKLCQGLRNPLTASNRPAEVGQAVRGPIDWTATISRRSLEAGDTTRFVVRSARRVYDVPENRALVWILDRLSSSCRRALGEKPDPLGTLTAGKGLGWTDRIRVLANQVERARRVDWLAGIEPEPPVGRVMQKLQAARSSFYREDVVAVARRMLALESPNEEDLVDVLCERYFEPAATWMIFEICVALRLAREFEETSGRPRRSRLLAGGGRAAFARYLLPDESEVALIYQGWPRDSGESLLGQTGKRHGMKMGTLRPDLFVVRSGDSPDALVLELKASHSPSYLKDGLVKLLGYLADRPALWQRKPAGWLVAPCSDAFASHPFEEGDDLWVVDADEVAAAVVSRFLPGGVDAPG